MHPAIQLCVAISLMVIAVRAWPLLAYVALAIMLLLLLIKICRRGARAIRRNISAPWFEPVSNFVIHVWVWLAIAAVADYFSPRQISALSIVLCFAGAYLVIAFVVIMANRIERH